jgi:hypothetical protein
LIQRSFAKSLGSRADAGGAVVGRAKENFLKIGRIKGVGSKGAQKRSLERASEPEMKIYFAYPLFLKIQKKGFSDLSPRGLHGPLLRVLYSK